MNWTAEFFQQNKIGQQRYNRQQQIAAQEWKHQQKRQNLYNTYFTFGIKYLVLSDIKYA